MSSDSLTEKKKWVMGVYIMNYDLSKQTWFKGLFLQLVMQNWLLFCRQH